MRLLPVRLPVSLSVKTALNFSLSGITLICLSGAAYAAPTLNSPGAKNGLKALKALGRSLQTVGAEHRMSGKKLERIFLSDKTLFVDIRNNKRLAYVEPVRSLLAEGPEAAMALEPPQLNYTPEQAFLLNSKPGASKVIFLDFDGHTISNTAWNSSIGANFQAPPYDIDGDPNSFSIEERNRIIGIWKRVSEDYAPFDVNVTTQFPGEDAITKGSSTDPFFGTRALITRKNNACSSCGGVAYVDVLGVATYQPAFVFFDQLGGGAEKYTAEAISHEVGHNLGLNHDGTTTGAAYYQGHGSGATGWAPIMGNGYYVPVTQFSKGEYPNANNTEDDYAIITRYLPYRTDDHSGTRGSATFINQGTSISESGVIGTRGDVDYFSFFANPGDVTLSLAPHSNGPNLDIELKVEDASGNLVAIANPSTDLAASVGFSVASAQTFYVRVDGVGLPATATDPGYSDYASLGFYRLSGTIPAGGQNTPPVAVISASATSGMAPLAVGFSGASSYDSDGQVVSYLWTFSDGQQAAGSDVSHIFDVAGTYPVTLTVTDNLGTSSSSATTVVVTPAPNVNPVAVASAASTSGMVAVPMSFSSNGSSDPDGSIAAYQWSFGDGGSSTSPNPSYTYYNPGTYTVTLTVTDNRGGTASSTLTVTIADNPSYIKSPSSLTGTVSGSSVALQWRDNSANETGFRIYRGVQSGKGKTVTVTWNARATVGSNVTSFTDTGVSGGTYLYRVEAYNSSASSTPSNEIKVTVRK